MPVLYKRPDSPYWYVTKTRESTKTSNRKFAEEFARKSLAEAWRVDALGEDEIHTWDELVETWLDLKADKRSIDRDQFITSDATDFFRRRELNDKPLAVITADKVRDYGAFVKARASASTANRHLAALRSILRKASDYGWIVKCPAIEMYPITRNVPRWLSPAEFDSLAEHLPEDLRDMATVAVQTGMRYSNVAGLRWDWIREDGMVAIVPATVTKTNRTYTIPLSAKAREILTRRRSNLSPVAVYVFPRDDADEPYGSIRAWWETACTKSGVECRFHDLRHTFASWHIQRRTPDRIVQQMCGWASPAMLERYAHLDLSHLTEFADNLNKV